MVDPVMLAVAAAIAGQVGEAAVDGVRASWRALVTLVHDHLSRNEADAAVLASALEEPDDTNRIEALAVALTTAGLADRSFQRRLLELCSQIEPGLPRGASVVNTISHSTVTGGVIQGGNVVIGGDVRFGWPSGRDAVGGSERMGR